MGALEISLDLAGVSQSSITSPEMIRSTTVLEFIIFKLIGLRLVRIDNLSYQFPESPGGRGEPQLRST
jgi:hypothetical protein